MTRKRTTLIVIGGLVALFAALVPWSSGRSVQRASASRSEAPDEQPSLAVPERTVRKPQHAIARSHLSRPAELFAPTDEERAQRYRTAQAHEMFGLLRQRLATVKLRSPDPNPESLATQTSDYLLGWVDSTVRVAPDLADELATEVDATLCASDRDPALALVSLRLLMAMPELSSEEGFDCVFAQDAPEDVVLWTALDAWHASGLPKSKAIAELEKTASDPRTRHFLVDPETRVQLREAEYQAAAARPQQTVEPILIEQPAQVQHDTAVR